ncbi:MAG TPA: hypothetical protein VK625_11450, partial [Flavitalea sp.]|nr:hypothetical protein [Flavitalea sp.]
MKHRFSRYLKFLTFVGDICILNGLFLLLYFKGHFIVQHDESWFYFLAIINLCWVAIVLYANSYKANRVYSLAKLVSTIFYSVAQHFLMLCTAIYFFDYQLVHKWGPWAVCTAFLVAIILWRLLFYYSLSLYRSKGYNFRNVVVVGFGAIAKELEVFFSLHPEYGYHFIGYFDDNFAGKKKLGDINSVDQYLKNESVIIDEVYCCLPYVKYGQIKKVIDMCEDRLIKVKVIGDFRALSFKGLELERYDHIPVLNVSSIPLDDRKNQITKRGFDILFSSLIILFVFSWLFPIIAFLIR